MFRITLATLLLVPLTLHAQPVKLVVSGGKKDLENVPVRVPLQWSKQPGESNVVDVDFGGVKLVGQLTEPSFANESVKADPGFTRKDLVFIAPKVKAGSATDVVVTSSTAKPTDTFEWNEKKGEHVDLAWKSGGKSSPILRYMNRTYDPSNAAARNKSYKVFHHVYDPETGKQLTNGGHTDSVAAGPLTDKEMTYPHHRGLMFGFNQCSYNGKKADTWHCTDGAHVEHEKTLFETAGPVMAEHRVQLGWHGKAEKFAEEERQMTVYKVPGGTLIEFATRLKPTVDKVKLDGDPQHAGFQFRASNDVAKKTASQTYYLRPDGKGKLGETRNWGGGKGPADLPWDVLSFVLDGNRYSVEYIDSPNNPGEKRYSERDYGRFGCYFVYDLTKETPLVLNHRVWVQPGEMTGEQAEAMREAFVNPPKAK